MDKEFLNAVRRMRRAQRQCKQYGDKVSRDWAQETEKIVDSMISAYDNPTLI